MNSENVPENNNASDAYSPRALKQGWLRIVVTWIIPAVIVIGALAFAKHQIDTRPKAERQKPPQQARLVTVQTAQQTNHQTVVSAMGTVVPAKQITLSPEVGGRIVFVSPLVIPGGAIQKGQTLIRIDSRDYETVVKQRESEVTKAQLNLKLEQGNQLVAQQEYEMLDDIVQDQDEELVLRKPHLEQAKAALEAAKSALAKAQLDVARCTITAPFNAVIQDKFVDVGAQVTASSSLLTLMGTDEYWVQVKVFVDELGWLTIPENNQQIGSSVKVYNSAAWGEGVYRDGMVLRLLGQLEEEGRLAQLLVSVKDPLSLENDLSDVPPILVDSYVRVDIEGTMLETVFGIKRDYLRDGDNIWIMNDEDRMEIRPVEVVFREKQMVYLSDGLQAGDRIVTTDISSPVDGMLLRLNDTPAPEPAEKNSDTPNPEAQE
ncbi:MAG: HlyD family efflux transporter periplasmic adaptor subunit [Phycisphaerae bacterium]|nr:HlyD family efflux transporter periplasmic adaptor subunit [Phycisphaerae bacterium]